jgi:hypothetical protein
MKLNDVAKLTAPAGWKWVTKPSNRVRGVLEIDTGQTITTGVKLVATLGALWTWAAKNELGLVADGTGADARKWYNLHFDEYLIQTRYKVSINKSASTKHYHDGEFVASCCGNPVPAGDIRHAGCGYVVSCQGCRISGWKLFKVDSLLTRRRRYLCHECAPVCTKEGCTNRQWLKEYAKYDGLCAEHSPVVACFACSTVFPREKSVKAIHGSTEKNCCPTCAKNVCKTCNTYSGTVARSKNGECKSCVLAHVDKDVEKHDTFTKDELPKGGSLIIKDLPERPYRIMSIETEMDGDKDVLAGVLYRCGVVRTPEVESYHSYPDTSIPWAAHLKHDGSVTAGELIFHCMNLDTQDHADALLLALSKLRGMEKTGHINFGEKCGGHIHIDAHNFGYGDVWRLITVWNYLEDVIYRLAGAGHQYGHRTLHPKYRPANGVGYSHSTVKGPFGSKAVASRSIAGQQRHSGLNFVPYIQAQGNCGCGAFGRGDGDGRDCTCDLGKRTIEWRVWNSTGNPRILHGWLAFMQALHAYCDTGEDPTSKWEADFTPMQYTRGVYKTSSNKAVESRLEWVFKNLMLTNDERDSLVYALKQSELKVLGTEFLNSLLKIVPIHAFPVKGKVKHYAARRTPLKIQPPTKGAQVKANTSVRAARAGYHNFVNDFVQANVR